MADRSPRVSRPGQRADGLAVIDKPAGWTSSDVVVKAKGILGTRKVGHAGTLDPDATGVLLLGVGRATRLLRFVGDLPKTYVGEVVLGTTTTTLDDQGEVTGTFDMAGVTLDQARAAARDLTGDIWQVPPMVSAVKVGGRRLHELARAGQEVERQPRPVTVMRFELDEVPGSPGVYRAEVTCSSGTYVRTLADDLGRALGGGAHLRRLRRTAIGSFTLAEAHPLEQITVLAPAEAVRHLASVQVSGEGAQAVRQGKVLDRAELGATGDGPWAVLDDAGELLAVYKAHKGSSTKPSMVLAATGDG